MFVILFTFKFLDFCITLLFNTNFPSYELPEL